MRPFDPDAEMQDQVPQPVIGGATVPLPEGGETDLRCDRRVNGEDNAQSAYSAYLNMESAVNRGHCPCFIFKNSNSIPKAHRRRRKETRVEIETDWHERDLKALRACEDFDGHLCT